jgi:hypothetical protein
MTIRKSPGRLRCRSFSFGGLVCVRIFHDRPLDFIRAASFQSDIPNPCRVVLTRTAKTGTVGAESRRRDKIRVMARLYRRAGSDLIPCAGTHEHGSIICCLIDQYLDQSFPLQIAQELLG